MIEAITREEIFLAKAIGETVPDLEPIIRQEMFLAKIAGMDIAPPVPVTREEMFLNAIANKEAIDLKPITRKEMFLAKAMGADVEVPTPITRVEFYLSQLTGGGSGGGTYEKYSWEGVFASIDKGTYATDYAIGDTVPLDLGSEGVINMQIAAFDTDDLADGSGKAPITWIAKELLATMHRWNPILVTNDDGTYQEGTGNIGGWEKCEMRTYLKEIVKPLIPGNVYERIQLITRITDGSDSSGVYSSGTVQDDVFIPDYSGIYNKYKNVFTINGGYIKRTIEGNAKVWCTSTANAYDLRYIYVFTDTGNKASNFNEAMQYGICLCFCT